MRDDLKPYVGDDATAAAAAALAATKEAAAASAAAASPSKEGGKGKGKGAKEAKEAEKKWVGKLVACVCALSPSLAWLSPANQ